MREDIACLLPARNSARELAGFLASAARLADYVIALDDGSTDATAAMLEDSALVSRVLRNPGRETSAGWNDSANRQRLLDAAIELGASWVVYIDSDERLDAADARALRDFLLSDAIPACAYGLQLFRTWPPGLHVPRHTWVYRAFAPEPDQRLPERPLHLNPVPRQIDEAFWIKTTIRVRHLDSVARISERQVKYEEADPENRYERGDTERWLAPPKDELQPWSPRPAGLAALDPGVVSSPGRQPAGRPTGPRVLCLLPVRNAEADLPGYLESAGRVADAVIALDDGSSDGTRALLEGSPLVDRVISNPVRDTFGGWDDRANRQALLEEAADVDPEWILWLDADERIDAADAAALRDFIERQAEPGSAYGLRVFRVSSDLSRFDRFSLWAYRLFHFDPGQELPSERLHLNPVPTSIPVSRRHRTTVRIQHLAGATPERRRARSQKYAEADPVGSRRGLYRGLEGGPQRWREWRARPAGLPVLADPMRQGRDAELDLATVDLDVPAISAIVISRDDEDRIERAVRSVVEQECSAPFEVIVVASGTDRTADIVRDRFPGVELIELSRPALPGEARNAGLAAARGDFVSFPGSHVELPPGSLEARLQAHERGYSMVTGSVLNGTPTAAGWASYFLDNAGSLPGRPGGELTGPPVRCSYARWALLDAGGFPEDLRAGEDTVVNRELAGRGHVAYREPAIRLTHSSPCRSAPRLLSHHFQRGRALARILAADRDGPTALLRGPLAGALLLRYLPARLRRIKRSVAGWADERTAREYRRPAVRVLIAAGCTAAWAGLWFEVGASLAGRLSARASGSARTSSRSRDARRSSASRSR